MARPLDTETRVTILRLAREGKGSRAIAKLLGHSRRAVMQVIQEKTPDVPEASRARSLDEHLERVKELYTSCEGNLVLVQKYLGEEDELEVCYSTLTSFARKHRLGLAPVRRVGEYVFAAGVEMQHDTSPHDVVVAGKKLRLQCASLVLGFSRMIYAQVYPTWRRFQVRLFLDEALRFFGGAAGRCMLDNSTVIIVSGTGADAIAAPEMVAFAKRYGGFVFKAHALNDANRSGKVERPFFFIETNFYPHRKFADLADLNRQLLAWCNEKNGSFRPKLGFCPAERFLEEKPFLRKLPAFLPEIYQILPRLVDPSAWVNLDLNRYSVPEAMISQQVEVRESRDRVKVYRGPRLLADHPRIPPFAGRRSLLPGHHTQAGWAWNRKSDQAFPDLPEAKTLAAQGAEFVQILAELKKTKGGRAVPAIRKLHQIFLDYPTEVVRAAIARALEHKLLDIDRIRRIVLRGLGAEVLRWPQLEGDMDSVECNDREEDDGTSEEDPPQVPSRAGATHRDPAGPGRAERSGRGLDTGSPGRGSDDGTGCAGDERPGAPAGGPEAEEDAGDPAAGSRPRDQPRVELPGLPGPAGAGGVAAEAREDDPEEDEGGEDP